MRRVIATFAFLVMALVRAPAPSLAQADGHQYAGEGYVFIGEGDYPTELSRHGMTHVGGGGEFVVQGGFGIECELGAMGRAGEGVGVFSVDPSYNILAKSGKSRFVPFVDVGYSRAFGNRSFTYSQNLLNFGGGFHYWVFKHAGLRLDFRDYVSSGTEGSATYPALRIGLAIRQ